MDDAIVLQDSRGEKVYTSIFGRALAFYGLGRQQFVVVRGELLVPIPGDEITPRKDGQKPHNYQLKRDPTVLLYCKDDGEDIAPLDKYESLLLEAIKNPTTRYEVFSASNILDWGSRLKLRDAVYVGLPTLHYAAAVIRYVGGLKTEPGIQFGVEITEAQFRGYGATDGSFQGEQIFLCEENCGLFVGLDRLSPDPQGRSHIKVASSQSITNESSARKSPESDQQHPDGSHQDGMLTHFRERSSNPMQHQASETTSVNAPQSTPSYVFSTGDKVVVYNKRNARVPGVVRWIGKVTGHGADFTAVGIETDYPVKKEDFADAMPNMSHYFKIQNSGRHGKVFLPEAFVVAEEVDSQQRAQEQRSDDSPTTNSLPEKKIFEAKLSQAQHKKQYIQERYTHLEKQLQQQKQQLLEDHARLEQQLKQERQQTARLRQEAAQQKQKHTRLEQQLRQERQEAAQERQAAAELKQQLEGQLQKLITDNQRLQQQVTDSQAEAQQTRLIQPQSTLEAIEYWKVPRRDIQIIREVGVGAWGSVSEGKYKDQLVAVKQPHRAILTTPIVKRLQREVQIMAQVRHPNLVRFIAAVFDDNVERLKEPPMIILELLDMNLRTAYERDVLGASKIPIFRDVAYALHYLHEHQDPIIHRDISTPNVLLEALPQGAWKAKVSDFGSANLEKRSKTAAEGAIIYSAPETFPHTDPTTLPPPQTTKIDVFSYGILLCEVITKQLPEDPTIYRQMLQQVKSQWLFMYDLIVSCTKRDPNERPTMAQVLDKLNKLPRPRLRQHS